MPCSHAARALAAIAPLALTITGCGEEVEADTQASIGVNERVEGIDALGFAAVTNGEGVATVVGTLLNTTDDRNELVEVNADSERGPVDVHLGNGGSLPLPSGEPVQLAPRQAITLKADELPVGLFIGLEMRFADDQEIEMQIPVEPREGPYAEIEVTEPPDGDVAPE